MAVEKLILRSIVYGVDKIPDTWFNYVPGGFYRSRDGEIKKNKAPGRQSGKSDTRRKDLDRGRKIRKDDLREEGYRSDLGQPPAHRRRSFDGVADEQPYYYSEGEQPGRSKSQRGYRSWDDDRYRPEDGYRGRSRHHQPQHRIHDWPPHNSYDHGRSRRKSHPNPDTTLRGSTFEPPPIGQYRAQGSAMGSGYVPYASLYGNRSQEPPQQGTLPHRPPRHAPQFPASEDPAARTRTRQINDEQPGFRPVFAVPDYRAGDTFGRCETDAVNAGFRGSGGRNRNGYHDRDRERNPIRGQSIPQARGNIPRRGDYDGRREASRYGYVNPNLDEPRSRYEERGDDRRERLPARVRQPYVHPSEPLINQVPTVRQSSNRRRADRRSDENDLGSTRSRGRDRQYQD